MKLYTNKDAFTLMNIYFATVMTLIQSRPDGAFPNIERAVKEMAYDNGAVHRGQTVESVLGNVMKFLYTKYSIEQLTTADKELGAYSQEDFEELTCGEHGVVPCSELLDELLNEGFNAL